MKLKLSFLTLLFLYSNTHAVTITDENSAPSDSTTYNNLSTDRVFRKRARYSEGCETPHRRPLEATSPNVDQGLTPQRPTFAFSDSHKQALRQAGISDVHIFKIELLQSALLRSPHGAPLNPSSYFKQSEIDAILQKVSSKELNTMIFSLKSLFEKKIPLSNLKPNVVHTPSIRSSCDESQGPLASKRLLHLFQECKEVNLQHITGYTFIEEDEPETPEQRSARRALQSDLFYTLELNRGVSSDDRTQTLNALDTTWSKYFDYMRLRKTGIEVKKYPKIRSLEMEDIFTKYVAKSYKSFTIDGCEVYFRDDDIDMKRMDTSRNSNASLLSQGCAPIGADGKPMNLHHLTRRHPGILVLVPESFHQQNSELLHFRSPQHMIQPKPLDRAVFSGWKETALKALGQHLLTPQSDMVEKQLSFDDAA